MKTKVISILDKKSPPNHSFVDGMLSRVLPNKEYEVTLVVTKNAKKLIGEKYYSSKCDSVLYERRGIKRFLNFFVLYKYLFRKIRQINNKRIIIFVRNEPIYLLTASLFRGKIDKLVYQQSFPHEKTSNSMKKYITLMIFKLVSNRVDGLLTVSPKGLKRLKRYFPNSTDNMYIPLLTNRMELIAKKDVNLNNEKEPLQFIYIGTHAASRKLQVLLKGIVKALSEYNVNARFTFIGGRRTEIDALGEFVDTKKYEQVKVIQFIEEMPRTELLNHLKKYDVGISLIPSNEIYVESSPTKLVEYMSNGLLVLGSNGIELQDKFIRESEGGLLIDYTSNDVARAIVKLCQNKDLVNEMKCNALSFASKELLYENYVEDFREIL